MWRRQKMRACVGAKKTSMNWSRACYEYSMSKESSRHLPQNSIHNWKNHPHKTYSSIDFSTLPSSSSYIAIWYYRLRKIYSATVNWRRQLLWKHMWLTRMNRMIRLLRNVKINPLDLLRRRKNYFIKKSAYKI